MAFISPEPITVEAWGGEVFINRFLQDVAPKGFRRIRYYGFLANAIGREALLKIQTTWLASMKACMVVLAQYAQALEQAESEGINLMKWTPVCPRLRRPVAVRPASTRVPPSRRDLLSTI